MSLLNVPYRTFPRVLSSPSAQSSRPSASTTTIARSRRNSSSASGRWSESGRKADSAPNTRCVYRPDKIALQTPSMLALEPERPSQHESMPPNDAGTTPVQPQTSGPAESAAAYVHMNDPGPSSTGSVRIWGPVVRAW